ncbi:TPA: hypothetical protein JLQ01_005014 [Escherichia coli]|nr:hypothetical protein [Escherichia coli]HAW2558020.1 hypothetical protein [Escherichia coli]HAW2582529.1 hypothetical protein [Escherichia coli]
MKFWMGCPDNVIAVGWGLIKMRISRFMVILMLTISNFCHASNCSYLNFWDASNSTWTSYGNVFSVGGLFVPTFTGGLAATYVASSGQTAYYSFPTSVTVASSNAPSYFSAIRGDGSWGGQLISEGMYDYVWVGGSTPYGIQYANKSGQNCSATVTLVPLAGTTSQSIGGISVLVGLEGGQRITATGSASTVTPMSTPQQNYVTLHFILSGIALNLSTSGRVTVTVPSGTPDGDYTGTIAMPYSISACGGQVVCQDANFLRHMRSDTSNINASIRIRVIDGKPVNPDTYCYASSGNRLSIQHGTLTPDRVNGDIKDNTITVSCTGGTKVPVKIKLSSVGTPNTSSQLTGNNGILTPMSNGIDSLVSLDNERVTEKTITVNSTAVVRVNSELKTGSGAVQVGQFSGNAIATISYN